MSINHSAPSLSGQSPFELLPTEIFEMITSDIVSNPWLPYTSRRFYRSLMTKSSRRFFLTKAFTRFGYPWRKVDLPGDQESWKDYVKVFMDIVELPWFYDACFSSDSRIRLINPPHLKAWGRTTHAACAMFLQPIWTQRLGAFVAEMIARHPDIVDHCNNTPRHIRQGLERAIQQGCIPAINMLSGLYLTQNDSEPENIYIQDSELPNSQWIKRWQHQNASTAAPMPGPRFLNLNSAILQVMSGQFGETNKPPTYPKTANAYITKFWARFSIQLKARELGPLLPVDFVIDVDYGFFWSQVVEVLYIRAYRNLPALEDDERIKEMAWAELNWARDVGGGRTNSGWELMAHYEDVRRKEEALIDAEATIESIAKEKGKFLTWEHWQQGPNGIRQSLCLKEMGETLDPSIYGSYEAIKTEYQRAFSEASNRP